MVIVFLFFQDVLVLAAEQVNVQIKQLSWAEAIQTLKSQNSAVTAAIQNEISAQNLVTAARSGFYPQLNASAASNRSYLSSAGSEPINSSSAQLNLTQNLFAGFYDLKKLEQSQENLKDAQAHLHSVLAQAISDLKQAVALLRHAQDSVQLSQKIQKRRSENMRIVELRFRGGRENKGAVLLSEAYFHQSKYDLNSALAQKGLAQIQLNQILGFEPGMQVQVSLLAEPLVSPNIEDDRLLAFVLETPDYRQALAQERSSQLSYEMSQAAYYPNLDLSASAGKVDTQFPLQNDKWFVGATLTIPLFAGGKDYGVVHSNSAKWMAAKANLQTLRNQTLLNIQRTRSEYLLVIERFQVEEKFQQAASLRAEIARNKYNNGLMSFEEWDQVEGDLILREKNVLASARDKIIAGAKWEQAVGKGEFP